MVTLRLSYSLWINTYFSLLTWYSCSYLLALSPAALKDSFYLCNATYLWAWLACSCNYLFSLSFYARRGWSYVFSCSHSLRTASSCLLIWAFSFSKLSNPSLALSYSLWIIINLSWLLLNSCRSLLKFSLSANVLLLFARSDSSSLCNAIILSLFLDSYCSSLRKLSF